ncbi:hypothetical protein NBRC116493_14770 [Aurantivibrio infirmus]
MSREVNLQMPDRYQRRRLEEWLGKGNSGNKHHTNRNTAEPLNDFLLIFQWVKVLMRNKTIKSLDRYLALCVVISSMRLTY